MLSSPRKPVSTMRIFSSAENCRRVPRRIFFTTCSAGSFTGPDFCPICAPSMATMGQKSSLPQLTRSVSVVLMPDSRVVGGVDCTVVFDSHLDQQRDDVVHRGIVVLVDAMRLLQRINDDEIDP